MEVEEDKAQDDEAGIDEGSSTEDPVPKQVLVEIEEQGTMPVQEDGAMAEQVAQPALTGLAVANAQP